jgi:hypothetical protein
MAAYVEVSQRGGDTARPMVCACSVWACSVWACSVWLPAAMTPAKVNNKVRRSIVDRPARWRGGEALNMAKNMAISRVLRTGQMV